MARTRRVPPTNEPPRFYWEIWRDPGQGYIPYFWEELTSQIMIFFLLLAVAIYAVWRSLQRRDRGPASPGSRPPAIQPLHRPAEPGPGRGDGGGEEGPGGREAGDHDQRRSAALVGDMNQVELVRRMVGGSNRGFVQEVVRMRERFHEGAAKH